ncbi:MAG: DNA methyltransferase [Vicinamibacterales bacterium]|jgi:site-specific DNA-methyltransferase (adenine-specific)
MNTRTTNDNPQQDPSTANRIINGDCTGVLKTIADESIDFVLTDPPYLVGYRDRSGRTIANDSRPESVLGAFDDVYRVLKPDNFCISFYGWNRVDAFFGAWRRAGFTPVGHMVWRKNYASSTGFLNARHEQAYLLAKGRPAKPARPLDDVQPWEYTGNHSHPTEKAVSILEPLIRTFSRPGDVVLDPFAGSGSTLVAAALSGRRYLGIELESRYCQLAEKRLAGASRFVQRKPAA